MTQKKQTAVQALIKALENDGLELFGMDEFLELEKRQIIDAVNNSCDAKQDYFEGNQEHDAMRGEQYYSEIYGGNNGQQ